MTINTCAFTCEQFYCTIHVLPTGFTLGIINKTINMTVALEWLIFTWFTDVNTGRNAQVAPDLGLSKISISLPILYKAYLFLKLKLTYASVTIISI